MRYDTTRESSSMESRGAVGLACRTATPESRSDCAPCGLTRRAGAAQAGRKAPGCPVFQGDTRRPPPASWTATWRRPLLLPRGAPAGAAHRPPGGRASDARRVPRRWRAAGSGARCLCRHDSDAPPPSTAGDAIPGGGVPVPQVGETGARAASGRGAGAIRGARASGGARALAAAHGLPDGVGMPVRQVPVVWEVLTGRTRTPGASTPEARPRVANTVGPASARWRPTGPAQPVVHPDDPGGRVGGAPADLRAFETDGATGSQSRSPQRAEAVQEGGPRPTTGGGEQTAGAATTRPPATRSPSTNVWPISGGRAATSGRRKQAGLGRWGAAHRGGAGRYAAVAGVAWPGQGPTGPLRPKPLWAASTPQLRPRLLTAPDHHRLRNGSGRQPDRGHLRRFLAAPQVEPTHKRAARVVRPAVSARQGSQGSKNQAGAQAVAACKRVGQTLAQQGVNSMVEGRYGLFRSARPHAAPP